MTQTPVEWLIQKLENNNWYGHNWEELKATALAMEKEREEAVKVDGFTEGYGQGLEHASLENQDIPKNNQTWQEALAIGRATNRWIPVSERLPDFDSLSDVEKITGVTVIAAWGSNASNVAEMRYVERTVRGKQVRRFEWQGRISPWEIIYWQPLPEPPKSE